MYPRPRNKYVIDSRDRFVSGFDLDGNELPQEDWAELLQAVFDSEYDAEEEIRAFVAGWLTSYGERKRRQAASA